MRWMKRQRIYSADEKIRKYSDVEIPDELSEALEKYALRIFDYITNNYIESTRSIRTGDLYTLDQTFVEEYTYLERLFDRYNKDNFDYEYYIEYQIEKYLERLINKISWIPLSIYFKPVFFPKRHIAVITRVNDNFVEDLKESVCKAINRWKFVSYFTGEKLKCFTEYPVYVAVEHLRSFIETGDPLDEVTARRNVKADEAFILYTTPQPNGTLSKKFDSEDIIERYVFVGYSRVSGLSGVTKDRKLLTDYVVIDSSIHIHMMGGYEFAFSGKM